jgi:DNA-binding GntR family transcriptional regulator
MEPQYVRVARDLRIRLAAQEWAVGERIPGISDLMKHYEIPSLNTIRQAEAILAEEGLLRPERGRGVFVTAHPVPVTDGNGEALEAIAQAMQLLRQAERALTQRKALSAAFSTREVTGRRSEDG